jgi:hypothetical protein
MAITLTPRYTDYKSAAAAKAAFDAGKDFTVADIFSKWTGMACNFNDLRNEGHTEARIRYDRQTKVVVVKILNPITVSAA